MAPLHGTRNVLLPHTNSGRILFSTPRNRTMNHINTRFSNGNLSPRVNVSNYSNDHPVEVVGRVRDFPDRKNSQQPAFEMVGEPNEEETTVRVKTEIGYRDFSLDGISLAEKEDLDGFYKTFIQNRVYGVKTGGKCTIIMYGPTGSGKSHTMFGCSKEPGIVYRALNQILGDQVNEDGVFRHILKVNVSVIEIYNEDIFDLLAPSNMPNIGWFKNGQRRDPNGAPIARESEASLPVTCLPSFPNQQGSYLACLRLCTQQVTAMFPCYTGKPLGSSKDQLAVRTPVQASPSSRLVSPAQQKVSRTSNLLASSRGK